MYIGITCQSTTERWRKGKGYKSNIGFTNAINKYGWDAFEHLIIYSDTSKEFAMEKEIELIRLFNTTSFQFGYNADSGGFAHSIETRRKIGKAHSGSKNYWSQHRHTEEYCQSMSQTLKGRVFTEEHKNHLSEAQIGEKNHMYGVTWPEEKRAERSQRYQGSANPNYGNKWTDAQKLAQSERLKGKRAQYFETKEGY